jgi:hypothetical protein
MGFIVEIYSYGSTKYKTIVHYDIIFPHSHFTNVDHNIFINTLMLCIWGSIPLDFVAWF